jgi:hypothetical protein
MTIQRICKQYAAFRRALGERFNVNGSQLNAFCRAIGQDIDIKNVSPERRTLFSLAEVPSQPARMSGTTRCLAFIDMLSVEGLSQRPHCHSPSLKACGHSNPISIHLLNSNTCWIRLNRAVDAAAISMCLRCALLFF